jgi:hypothetical protein
MMWALAFLHALGKADYIWVQLNVELRRLLRLRVLIDQSDILFTGMAERAATALVGNS